jgi:hypothetical protein
LTITVFIRCQLDRFKRAVHAGTEGTIWTADEAELLVECRGEERKKSGPRARVCGLPREDSER